MDTGGLQIRTLYRMSAVAFTTNKHQVQIRSTHRIPCEQQHAQRSRLLIGVAMVASIEFDAQSSGDLVHCTTQCVRTNPARTPPTTSAS
eukprot:m.392420 g.392420  ORF g.392420 m.392420 type:complete len:89 (+) comp21078_c2_seq38:1651-1917(+)